MGGGDELDAFVGEDFGDRAEEHVGVAGAEVEEELGEAPVGADGGEDLLVLTWPAMTARVTPSRLEGFDELRELAEREPVDVDVGVGGGAGVDLGIGLFLDGGDDDVRPWARAASRSRKGKRPLPAMRPSLLALLPGWVGFVICYRFDRWSWRGTPYPPIARLEVYCNQQPTGG